MDPNPDLPELDSPAVVALLLCPMGFRLQSRLPRNDGKERWISVQSRDEICCGVLGVGL